MCAHVLGIEYDLQDIDLLKKQNREPEYLTIHPAGMIPAMDDEGLILFESLSICRYLCRKHRSSLYPQEVTAQAHVDQWCDFSSIHVGAELTRVLIHHVFSEQLGFKQDPQVIRVGLHLLGEYLPVLEQRLSATSYLAGDDMSLADINLLAELDPIDLIPVDMGLYPKLGRWREQLRSQTFYTQVHDHYGQ